MSRPKVAILIPSKDQWAAEFGMCLASMVPNALQVARVGLINERGGMITGARCALVKQALDGPLGADYCMWLDADMTFPPNIVERLLAHNKDIVGATYCRRVPPFNLLGRELHGEADTGLVEMETMPGGCMLIKADVYSKLTWPWYYESYDGGMIHSEDYNFCADAIKAGYSVWCDMDMTKELGHIGSQCVYYGS